MKRVFVTLASLILCAGVSLAQKGVAEPDYYPMNYSGDTWTGEVTAVNEDTREFTLAYHKGDKEETFVGVLEKGYKVKRKDDGKDYELKMVDLMGMRVTGYFANSTITCVILQFSRDLPWGMEENP